MKIKIDGLNELKKDLKNLSDKEVKNITTSALRAGASEISKRAKQNVPIDTGDLKKAIGVNKKNTRDKTFIKFIVSPRANQTITQKGKKRNINQSNYAVNVEYGTVFQTAQPFMRNTFDQLGQNVTNAITKKMAQRIEKASNK